MSIIKQDFGEFNIIFNETVLWSNPNPAANMAPLSVTLSDSIDNYDFIKVTSRASVTDTTYLGAVLMSVEDFKKTKSSGPWLIFAGTTRRALYYQTLTTAYIDAPDGGSTYGSNIPIGIIGVKL